MFWNELMKMMIVVIIMNINVIMMLSIDIYKDQNDIEHNSCRSDFFLENLKYTFAFQ